MVSRARIGGKKAGAIQRERALARMKSRGVLKSGEEALVPRGTKAARKWREKKWGEYSKIQRRRAEREYINENLFDTYFEKYEREYSGIRGDRKAGRMKREYSRKKSPFTLSEHSISKKELNQVEEDFKLNVPEKIEKAKKRAEGKRGKKVKGAGRNNSSIVDPYEGIIRFPIFYDIDVVLDIKDDIDVSDDVKRELIEYIKKTNVKGRGRPRVLERLMKGGIMRKKGTAPREVGEIYNVIKYLEKQGLEPKRHGVGVAANLSSVKKKVLKREKDTSWDEDAQEMVTTYSKKRVVERVAGAITLMQAKQQYLETLNRTIVDNGVVTEAAYQYLNILSFLQTYLVMYEKKGESKSYYEITKLSFLPLLTEVMAEFVLSGMRERLKAQGLGSSELYKSLKVHPFYVGGEGDVDLMSQMAGKAKEFKVPVYVGVIVEMKYYGVYVDIGRGPTRNSSGVEDYHDSPFYKALYKWAIDNVNFAIKGGVVSMGFGGSERLAASGNVTSAREVQEKKPVLFSRMPISKIYTDQYAMLPQPLEKFNPEGEGASEWMKKVGRDEKPVAADRRGRKVQVRSEKGSRDYGDNGITFDDIVYLIYRAINKRGFQGNGFLLDTLKEMMETGKMEYYMSRYLEDALTEYANYHTKSLLQQLPTSRSNKGAKVTVQKG